MSVADLPEDWWVDNHCQSVVLDPEKVAKEIERQRRLVVLSRKWVAEAADEHGPGADEILSLLKEIDGAIA